MANALTHLLSSMGIDGPAIVAQFEALKTQLPEFARQLKAKVDSMDARIAGIEQTNAQILANQREILSRLPSVESAKRTAIAESVYDRFNDGRAS